MKLNPKSEWFRFSRDGFRLVPQTWEGVLIGFGSVAIFASGIVLLVAATR